MAPDIDVRLVKYNEVLRPGDLFMGTRDQFEQIGPHMVGFKNTGLKITIYRPITNHLKVIDVLKKEVIRLKPFERKYAEVHSCVTGYIGLIINQFNAGAPSGTEILHLSKKIQELLETSK